MPVITHLIFNLRLLNFTEKLQPILFLPFEISADSNGKHLGRRMDEWGVTHKLESEPTKDHSAQVLSRRF
jgi:hypothetical protein